MPKNYSAYIRYHVINRKLSQRGRATLRELKEACERALDIYPLGDRTIEKDIHDMRYDQGLGFNAPIKIDRSTGEYYYEEPDFTIDERSLSDEEIISLMFVTQLLEQFKDLDVFKTFRGTVQKLIDVVAIFTEDTGNNLRNKIEFEHMPELKGSEYIEMILNSLSKNIVLKIEYQSFYSTKVNTHIIHPYYLKEYRNRWYIIGYHEEFKGIRTYGLDRIKSILQLSNKTFIESEFVAKEYYKNIVGVTALDRKPIEVRISANKERSLYLKTQPLHDSQEIVEENEVEVIFKYLVVPTFEFKAQILSWGDSVKVLEPKEFREEIIKSLQSNLSQYRSI
jgi:predicted DNA-binding transcriptional regulator YafY